MNPLRTVRGHPMGCPWTLNGLHSPPTPNDSPPNCPCTPRGLYKDCPRTHHGRFTHCLSTPHELFMAAQRAVHEDLTDVCLQDQSVGCAPGAHRALMNSPWVFMDSPWHVRGASVGCRGLFVDAPRTSQRLSSKRTTHPTGCSWATHGHPMHMTPTVIGWTVDGVSKDNVSVVCGQSVGC